MTVSQKLSTSTKTKKIGQKSNSRSLETPLTRKNNSLLSFQKKKKKRVWIISEAFSKRHLLDYFFADSEKTLENNKIISHWEVIFFLSFAVSVWKKLLNWVGPIGYLQSAMLIKMQTFNQWKSQEKINNSILYLCAAKCHYLRICEQYSINFNCYWRNKCFSH